MCHLHLSTHPCGCRDESRIVVCDRLTNHEGDARCFETLSSRRRRRRYCARHQPTTHTISSPSPSPPTTPLHPHLYPHPAVAAAAAGAAAASASWEYQRPEYNVYGQYHSSFFSP